jgi:pyridoxine kinase
LSGYIADPSVVEELAAIVRSLPARQEYVADPVFGDNGKMYVSADIPKLFEELLLPLATVITPNAFEAEVLTGVKIGTLEDAARCCRVLFDKGCELKTVIITSCSLGQHEDRVTLVAAIRESPRVLVSHVDRLNGYYIVGMIESRVARSLTHSLTHRSFVFARGRAICSRRCFSAT